MKKTLPILLSVFAFSLTVMRAAPDNPQTKEDEARIRKAVRAAAEFMSKKNYAEAKKTCEALAADPAVTKPADQALYRMKAAIADVHLQKKSPESLARLTALYAETYPLLAPEQKPNIAQSCASLLPDQESALELCRKVWDDLKNAPRPISRAFVQDLCSRYIRAEKIEEAEKIADEYYARLLENASAAEILEFLKKSYGAILTLQDKNSEYTGVIEKGIASRKSEKDKKQLMLFLASFYESAGEKQKAAELYSSLGERLKAAFASGGDAAQRKEAEKMLADKTLPVSARAGAFAVFFWDTPVDAGCYYRQSRPPENVTENMKIRTMYGPEFYENKDLKGPFHSGWAVNAASWFGLYESVISMVYPEFLAGRTLSMQSALQLAAALVSVGRDGDAIKVMTAEAENGKRNLERRILASLFIRILKTADEAEIRREYETVCAKFREEKGFSERLASGTLIDMGRFFAAGRKYDALRSLWNVYEGLFRHQAKRTMTLKFSDEPVRGLGALKAMNLEPQLMDRKFQGTMDLVTDVSTGRTQAAAGEIKLHKPPEFRAACDENGIHMLFHIFDERAELIQTGMIGGGGFEMYFAPGENQPYTCLLSDNGAGTITCWNTTYPNMHHRHFDEKKPGSFRYEQQFDREGYDCYLFLSWTALYDKLPEKGDFYEFENVFWGPHGGESWNGMTGVHARTHWGRLFFDITPAQMTKIKRKILLSAMPEYRRQHWTGINHHGVYELWQDQVLGDPAFYQAKILPLRKKLDEAASAVKKDISDEDVNRIFDAFIGDFRELRGTVEEMRRLWLEEKLSAE